MTIKLTAAQKIKVLNANDLYKIMQQVLLREKKIDRDKEHCWLVCLSTSNRILMIELISLGSVKSIIVEPMDVFSFALQKRAVKIIMVHNHPSGSLEPSRADLDLTEKMMAIGRFIEMPIIDHLIISEISFFSFAAMGLMQHLEERSNIDLSFKKQEAQEKELQELKKQLDRQLRNQQQQLNDLKIKIAKDLLKNGTSIELIIKSTGISLAEIEKLLPKKKKA